MKRDLWITLGATLLGVLCAVFIVNPSLALDIAGWFSVAVFFGVVIAGFVIEIKQFKEENRK